MHRYGDIICLLLIHRFMQSSALTCAYPRLVKICDEIALSNNSDWVKVNKWKSVINSIDLTYVDCDEETVENSLGKVLHITSPLDSSLFDFEFSGSVDKNDKFKGQGNYFEIGF